MSKPKKDQDKEDAYYTEEEEEEEEADEEDYDRRRERTKDSSSGQRQSRYVKIGVDAAVLAFEENKHCTYCGKKILRDWYSKSDSRCPEINVRLYYGGDGIRFDDYKNRVLVAVCKKWFNDLSMQKPAGEYFFTNICLAGNHFNRFYYEKISKQSTYARQVRNLRLNIR